MSRYEIWEWTEVIVGSTPTYSFRKATDPGEMPPLGAPQYTFPVEVKGASPASHIMTVYADGGYECNGVVSKVRKAKQ